jgi:hypothetical protein
VGLGVPGGFGLALRLRAAEGGLATRGTGRDFSNIPAF